MNLIKILGGYENAKKFANNEHSNGFDMQVLNHELLEYRRAHNIFEVEDVACYKNQANPSNTLFKFFHDNEYLDIISLLRHATPEEIKAGKRL